MSTNAGEQAIKHQIEFLEERLDEIQRAYDESERLMQSAQRDISSLTDQINECEAALVILRAAA